MPRLDPLSGYERVCFFTNTPLHGGGFRVMGRLRTVRLDLSPNQLRMLSRLYASVIPQTIAGSELTDLEEQSLDAQY